MFVQRTLELSWVFCFITNSFYMRLNFKSLILWLFHLKCSWLLLLNTIKNIKFESEKHLNEVFFYFIANNYANNRLFKQ